LIAILQITQFEPILSIFFLKQCIDVLDQVEGIHQSLLVEVFEEDLLDLPGDLVGFLQGEVGREYQLDVLLYVGVT